MKDMKQILEHVGSLPPLPGTALKLMNVINEPSSTVHDIVVAIRYDQAVTTEVLKLCNSAYFGLSRQVTSLSDAMRFLGTVKVLQLVMAVHTNGLLSRAQPGYGLAPGVLWKHSVAVALACAAFAQRLGLADANLLFTAGLLHDIGKVVLSQHVAEEFAKIVRLVTEDKLSFVEAELRVLGFCHQRAGALLARRWQLPEEITRCIRHHHDPSGLDPPDKLVDVVYMGNAVCLLLGLGLGEDGLYSRAREDVLQRHNLTERDLEAVGPQIVADLKQVEQMFDDTAGGHPNKVAARG